MSENHPVADQKFSVRCHKEEVAYQGAIWQVRADTFEYPSAHGNQTLRREYIGHPGAVAILACNDEQQILLLEQYRHPVGEKLWEIPAGLLDVPGESPQQAAARELAEEADLRAEQWSHLLDFYTTPGSSSERISIFLAQQLHPVPEAERHQRSGEEIDMRTRWVDLEEACALVLASKLKNPSTALAVLAYAAQQRR